MLNFKTIINKDGFSLGISKENICRLILSCPEKRNSLNEHLLIESTKALRELSNSGYVRFLIIEGEGKIFCAGADLNEMRENAFKPFEENLMNAQVLADFFMTLSDFQAPVISFVQGGAYGGGLGIVICSDYSLAVENTLFSFSEVKLGLVPGVISPFVIRKIGVSHASALMLSGERFDASKALKYNIINAKCHATDFEQRKQKLIDVFLENSPIAMRQTKELILKAHPLPDSETVNFSIRQISKARANPEGQDGVAAFFEKRLPMWRLHRNESH